MARAKAALESVPTPETARGARRSARRTPSPRVAYERRYRQTVRSIDIWSVLKITYWCTSRSRLS